MARSVVVGDMMADSAELPSTGVFSSSFCTVVCCHNLEDDGDNDNDDENDVMDKSLTRIRPEGSRTTQILDRPVNGAGPRKAFTFP